MLLKIARWITCLIISTLFFILSHEIQKIHAWIFSDWKDNLAISFCGSGTLTTGLSLTATTGTWTTTTECVE